MNSKVQSGANTAASITLTASPDQRHKLQEVLWSYSGTPTGKITVTGLEGDDMDVDVTAGGTGAIPLPPAAYGRVNTSVVITIAAGGAGVIGKLNVFHERE